MIIKCEDGTPIEKLCKTSQKKVIAVCNNCKSEFSIRYITYNKTNELLCSKCRGKKNAITGSKKISEKLKKSWESGNRKKPYKEKYYYELNDMFKAEGYYLKTDLESYLYGDKFVEYICPNGHIGKVSYKQWKNDRGRCQKCKEEKRLERIYKLADYYEHKIVNIKGKYITYLCRNNHENTTLLSNYYQGHDCLYCDFEGKSSRPELEIKEFLNDLNIFNIISNNREIISPYEIDIYLPDYNLAIEYDGYPYHTEKFKPDKNSHLVKTILCENKGIKLLHIFYDEWQYKKDIVKHRLKHILGKADKTIYARNCFVKEIDNKIAENFCLRYHIQGYQPSKTKLGLFHNKELVSVMTFGKQSLSKGNKNFDNNIWEISRFCSKYNIIGAAGKLLSYFKNNYEWDKITTFADRRWGTGNLYSKLGFDFVGYTKPNYWYINMKSDEKKREHRFKYRKDKVKHLAESENMTEWEIMQSNGYTRIWDCGHVKFEMPKSQTTYHPIL